MTHPTDEELDALVGRMSKLADDMEKHATYDWDEHEDVRATLNVITTLRTQLAEAKAEKERLGRELNLARYGQPDFSWQVHKEALAEANARADRAEAQLAEALNEVFDFPDRKAMSRRIREQRKLIRKLQVESNARWRLLMSRSDRAEAERAAQIGEACAVIDAHAEYDQAFCCDGRECGCQGVSVHDVMKQYIMQPHDRTALDRMLAEAREKTLREVAETTRGWRNDVPMTGDECANAILAMIEKEGA